MARFLTAHFLCQMVFLQGIVVHFFVDRGFSVAEILFFKNMVFVASMILQIPSGVLADKFGRRIVMLVGAATKAIGCLIIAVWVDIWTMVIAYLLIGAGLSLYQAGDVAYVYERSASISDPLAARRAIAKLTIVATLGIFISTVLGGYISAYDLGLVAWVNCVVAFCALGVLATCDLDAGGGAEDRKLAIGPGGKKGPASGQPIHAGSVAAFVLVAGALFYVPSLLAITTFQAFWSDSGVTALQAAQMTAIVGLAGALVTYFVAGSALAAGPWMFLAGGTVLLTLALLIGGMSYVAAMVIAAMLFECLKAYAIVCGRVVLNDAVSDRNRGTWNSCFLWAGQTGVVIGGPIWGAKIESDGRQAMSEATWIAILSAV
ncbi:MAG: MFS transporter, partial [Azospirillum sp.]|nr:MFS transporter [Azospirillum sp.]